MPKSAKEPIVKLPVSEFTLAAKYFTVSDTGLLTDDLKKRCNHSINQMYNQVSSDYANEIGTGLDLELMDWFKIIKDGLAASMAKEWDTKKLEYHEFRTPSK